MRDKQIAIKEWMCERCGGDHECPATRVEKSWVSRDAKWW